MLKRTYGKCSGCGKEIETVEWYQRELNKVMIEKDEMFSEADAEIERLKLALQGRTVSCEACNDMAKKLADIGAVVEEEETYILEDSCDESKFFSYKLDKIKSILEGERWKSLKKN